MATSESEAEWIAFALKYPGARLKAEVKEAVRKNRSKPRHAGHLTVQGSPVEGVAWTVAAGEKSTDFWSRLKELNSVPTVFPEGRVVTSDATSTAVDPKVTVDSEVKSSTRFRDLVSALRTLGFSAAQAKRRLERVWESFGARVNETSDEEIVKSALRMRAA